MKIAIVGSRNIEQINIEKYLPDGCEEIISGGAIGVDRCAAVYAQTQGIKLTEFYPLYTKYGRVAPILRNRQIVEYADMVLAFWNGESKGTFSVIRYCEKIGKPYKIIECK